MMKHLLLLFALGLLHEAEGKGSPFPDGIPGRSTSYCGSSTRTIRGNRRGYLKSPGWGSGSYANNQDCIWNLQGVGSRNLRLRFQTLTMEEDAGCDRDYILVHDGPSGQFMAKFCGNQCAGTTITLPSNNAVVTYHSNEDVTARGFRIKFWRVSSSATPGVRCNCDSSEGCFTCGGTLTAPFGQISSPNFPNNYYNQETCVWQISLGTDQYIAFEFSALDIEYETNCGYDRVSITQPGAEGAVLDVCGDTCMPTLMVGGGSATVTFTSDYSVTASGFQLDYAVLPADIGISMDLVCNCGEGEGCTGPNAQYNSVVTDAPEPEPCGGTYSGASGDVYSINYPNNYPNNQECTTVISVTPGSNMMLEFHHFSLEFHAQCIWDRLVVIGGEQTTTLCGSHTDAMFIEDDTVTLVFTSDTSVTDTGYHISFHEEVVDGDDGGNVGGSSVCGGDFTEPSGFIESPNFPDNYPNYMDCTWRITVESDKVIRLTTGMFHLESHSSCGYDRLVYYDGPIMDGTPSQFYCGTAFPVTVTSSGNEISLVFTSDVSVTYGGFSIAYESVDPSDTSEPGNPDGVECGVVPSSLNSDLIVGGSDADAHAYPWQIYLEQNYGFICGGSVISESWIVTAAHCVSGSSASSLTVVAGSHNRPMFEATKQYRSVSEVISHASYSTYTLYNDIALLKLSSPLTWTDEVRPICIPSVTAPVGESCVISGWGDTETGGLPSLLQVATVPILANSVCDNSYSNLGASMVCAGYLSGGTDTCQGDSGGPLACPDADSIYRLQGITSWGIGCADPNYPGVYTRVADYASWIYTNTGGVVTSN